MDFLLQVMKISFNNIGLASEECVYAHIGRSSMMGLMKLSTIQDSLIFQKRKVQLQGDRVLQAAHGSLCVHLHTPHCNGLSKKYAT